MLLLIMQIPRAFICLLTAHSNFCVDSDISYCESKALWWAFLTPERNYHHQSIPACRLHFVSEDQTALRDYILPADICNRASKCFSGWCVDCSKTHIVLNVVFLLIAEPVPADREPLEMRDFISGLSTGSGRGCPDNTHGFVLHAEKWERTSAHGGTAPQAHSILFFLMSVLTSTLNLFCFNFSWLYCSIAHWSLNTSFYWFKTVKLSE